MGAFLLIRKNKNQTDEEIETEYAESLKIFVRKGLSLDRKIIRDEYILFLFHKFSSKQKNLFESEISDDFICSVGTLIYNEKIGYDVFLTSAESNSGIKELEYSISNKKWV